MAMQAFLETYTWDLVGILGMMGWHVVFLILFGFWMANILLVRISWMDSNVSGGNIDIQEGWKMLLFGMFYGSVAYLGGIAVEFGGASVMQLVGYNGSL